MPIQIDFSQVDDNNLIPDGKYPVIVDSVQAKDSADGTSVYLEWYVQITEGDHMGRRVRMITSTKSSALWRLKAVLRSLEVPVDGPINFEMDDEGHILAPDLVGRVALAVISSSTYEKVTRNQCDDLLPISEIDAISIPVPTADTTADLPRAAKPKGGLKPK